ncbi:MAG: hypothetical protein M5U28_33225 [Sandaracinaceae bacterium]|nr:hypothetical protein [Sandaracinaceae bacterium]
MREMPNDRHLRELAQRPGPWVTICMPLVGGGPLAKGDPIRYRNLLREVQGSARRARDRAGAQEALLAPLEALGREHDVFNAGARGLVVFASPASAEHWHLPFELAETARVDERPYLEPLIPLVTDPVHFYAIALSMHDVRLIECSRFVARQLPLPEGDAAPARGRGRLGGAAGHAPVPRPALGAAARLGQHAQAPHAERQRGQPARLPRAGVRQGRRERRRRQVRARSRSRPSGPPSPTRARRSC